MNAYTAEFFANCPSNGVRIKYRWRIETMGVLSVEHILATLESVDNDYHENIADQLSSRFAGKQTMTAEHHGVTIETTR